MKDQKKYEDLDRICLEVKELMNLNQYKECEEIIINSMCKFPHSPKPHNLIGILLEKQGDHVNAMKHFRAALALEYTYLPARQNLDYFGDFYSDMQCAYVESDCEIQNKNNILGGL